MSTVVCCNAAELADAYLRDRFGRALSVPSARCPDLDDGLCARVAEMFEQLVARPMDAVAPQLYQGVRDQTREQFDVLRGAGVQVRPWLRDGQPYRGAREMCEQLRQTGTLYVYLT